MQQVLIFCHGWAGRVNFWDNLRQFLLSTQKMQHAAAKNMIFIDLGYFGQASSLPENILHAKDLEFIGIGHSLGLAKLLALGIKFKGLIGLNGFINFLGNDFDLRQRRTMELQLMQQQFAVVPEETIENFYNLIGVNLEVQKLACLNITRLSRDLNALYYPSKLSASIPLLIIGSNNDIIVPPKLIYDNFNDLSMVDIEILATGGHGLGSVQVAIIWQKITEFLYDIT